MIDSNEDADVDYGPLSQLIGSWAGDKGLDIAPDPDGKEENPYYETIVFEACGDAQNAESQTLAVVRYLQIVRRKSDDKVFHDQTGYWMWDAAKGVIMQSLVIPRAVCVLAGGKHSGTLQPGAGTVLTVGAKLGDPDWGIVQSPFMRDNASTLSFTHDLKVSDRKLSYFETTVVDIYGQPFEHTDKNELTRR